jgi:histidine triad (HIT) family protein
VAAVSCVFCSIIQGERAADIVFRDEISLAFLDYRPVFPGHLLLVPRAHFETLPDLPPDLVGPFFQNAQLLTRALEVGLEADGAFVAMNNRVSQSVPHLHVHLVPRRRGDGLRGFFWPRGRYADRTAVEEVQSRLARAISGLVPGSS